MITTSSPAALTLIYGISQGESIPDYWM